MQNKKIVAHPSLGGANRYVELQGSCFENCGYTVVPPSLSALYNLKKNGDVVILNWIESSLRTENGRFRPLGFIKLCLFLSMIKGLKLPFLWVRHTILPHDVHGLAAFFAKWSIAILTKTADRVVVHSKDFVTDKKHIYIPHPLYSHKPPINQPFSDPLKILYFGIYRDYKKLDEQLMIWPKDISLTLIGTGPQYLVKKLKTISNRRGLDTTILNEFIREEDLPEMFANFDAILIPHIDSSAIVSGVFFQAKTYGNLILLRGQRHAAQFGDADGLYNFDNAQELAAAINSLTEESKTKSISEIRERSEKTNGQIKHQTMWQEAINLVSKESSDDNMDTHA